MSQFISLSSGSSGNCYYLQVDDYGLIIDQGLSVRKFKQICFELWLEHSKDKSHIGDA